MSEIKTLIKLCKKNLSLKGQIFIFTLDPNKNEIPTFKKMREKLQQSLSRDKKIVNLIKNTNKSIIKNFIYKVKIKKQRYLKEILYRFSGW